MSFSDFGEEQSTQPSLAMFGHQAYDASDLLEQLHELSCCISEIRPHRNDEPVTIYLGGDAAAVLNNFTHQSVDGMRVFAANPLEVGLIAQVVESLELNNELRIQLANKTLQNTMDAVPKIMQRITADAASIEPIFSSSALKAIIPRWEIPYSIKMHELAFHGHDDSTLSWASKFLVDYLLATTMGPSIDHILESSIQEHIQASYPQDKRYVPRSTLDKVNRRCKECFDVEPILFEG